MPVDELPDGRGGESDREGEVVVATAGRDCPSPFDSQPNDIYVYEIPGRRDEWMKPAPSAHNRYVKSQNDRLDKRVKQLVRLVKSWSYCHDLGLSSFYLEMHMPRVLRGRAVNPVLHRAAQHLPQAHHHRAPRHERPLGDHGPNSRVFMRRQADNCAHLCQSGAHLSGRCRASLVERRQLSYYMEMVKVFPDCPCGVGGERFAARRARDVPTAR